MAQTLEDLELLSEILSKPIEIIPARQAIEVVVNDVGVEPRMFWMARADGGQQWEIVFKGEAKTFKEANKIVQGWKPMGLNKLWNRNRYTLPGTDYEYWSSQTNEFFKYAISVKNGQLV